MDEQGEERLQAMEAWEAMVCRGMGRASYSRLTPAFSKAKLRILRPRDHSGSSDYPAAVAFIKRKGKGCCGCGLTESAWKQRQKLMCSQTRRPAGTCNLRMKYLAKAFTSGIKP